MKALVYNRALTPEGLDPSRRGAESIESRLLDAWEPPDGSVALRFSDISDGVTVHRRGLQLMLAQVRRGADMVVVTNFDRLGQSYCIGKILGILAAHDCSVQVLGERGKVYSPSELAGLADYHEPAKAGKLVP